RSSFESRLDFLQNEVIKLREALKTAEQKRDWDAKMQKQAAEVSKPAQVEKPAEPAPQVAAAPKPPVPTPPVSETPKSVLPPVISNATRPSYPERKPIPLPEPEPELSFFERYPDLEKFIGENLVNKIGIAILVLSIAYFVKYAIDSNWVGPVGRVAIGMLCGGILIGFAHRMRNNYKAFSSVLVGGGLAVFYFTITLAFHQFHLFNQITAFIILIVITAFAVMLSLLYDKQELAIIALIGGFSSPFMVSTGSANYNGLLLYLVVLNTGLLIIAYYKSWRLLNIISFALTVLVFGVVLAQLTGPTYHLGLIYSSIFYLLYLAINIAYNVRENKAFIASDFSILLINTALYFSVGLYLLSEMQYGQYRGLFSAALGFLNLGLSYVLFRNKKVDANILYLLIGITLTFVSLTAPIQLKGNNITLFWASEAVLLYWLYLKSGIKLSRLTAQIIWAAMLISLFMDWVIYSNAGVITILANKGFITTLYSAAATLLLAWQVKKDDTEEDRFEFKIPAIHLQIVAIVLFFMAGALEINHQFSTRYNLVHLNVLYLMLYLPAFVLLLNLLSNKIESLRFNWQIRLGLIAVSIVSYFACFSSFFDLQQQILLTSPDYGWHFAAHWLSMALIALLYYQAIRICRQHLEGQGLANMTWILCLSIVFFLSCDFCLAANMIFYSKTNPLPGIQDVYIKTALPVLWGLCSFAMMWLGMRHKDRTLRIVSLSLFSATLLKLFLFDIRNIPAAGKIVAFFCLGVLLLIVSFMYQKVKKIIIADEEQSS
ncbi:MAG TPA: DUF2339 domain-containing protein, partial [Pedobacter sp.]